jgi:aryl-alcohol dehydrogenase-like predicted oxidoreductase
MKSKEKKLILGTALWGWGVDKKEAFLILDNFIKLGGYYIDCATNYPINKNINDYGLALEWLEEWNEINKIKLFIIVKIGSIDNLGSPSCDISKNRIISISEDLSNRFGDSLGCISIHWDNSVEDNDFEAVKEVLATLKELKNNGLSIGLSGIKNPSLYYNALPELSDSWIIQCKENFLTDKSRLSYQEFFPLAEYYAYGINMGGLKISEKEESVSAKIRDINYSDKLKLLISNALNNEMVKNIELNSVNDLNMAFIYVNKTYNGIIIGPRTTKQLSSTFKTWNTLINLNINSLEVLKVFISQIHNRIKKLD